MHKGNNYTDKFHNNKSNMFPMGTLSFQASQPIRSGNDMLVSIDTIKCFLGKIGERYSFKKKPDSQIENFNRTICKLSNGNHSDR